MKFNKEEKDIVQKLHLLSGIPFEECKEFFKYLVVLVTIDYMEGRDSKIPFIGDLTIKFLGDSIKKKGKEAILQIDVDSDPFLRRLVGDIEDGSETEIHRLLKRDIKRYFERFEEDE